MGHHQVPRAKPVGRLLERLVQVDQTSISSKGLDAVSASAKACAKVYAFLTGTTEAGDLGTYATQPALADR